MGIAIFFFFILFKNQKETFVKVTLFVKKTKQNERYILQNRKYSV